MALYVDSSAFLKLYFDEPDSDLAEEILSSDTDWVSARHTSVEVRRNLARELRGRELIEAKRQFGRDWRGVAVVELTEKVCEAACEIAEVIEVRTFDALHLGAAREAGGGSLALVTFDIRQAQAARALGWVVLGT